MIRRLIRLECFAICVSLAVLLAACGRFPDAAALAGEYEAKYDFGRERLVLRPDGGYEQNLFPGNASTSTSHAGRWDFDYERQLVIVHNPLLFADNFGKLNPMYVTPVDGSWNLAARRRFGSIVLSWNDDVGVKLKRVR
jgi:hypothetical protein